MYIAQRRYRTRNGGWHMIVSSTYNVQIQNQQQQQQKEIAALTMKGHGARRVPFNLSSSLSLWTCRALRIISRPTYYARNWPFAVTVESLCIVCSTLTTTTTKSPTRAAAAGSVVQYACRNIIQGWYHHAATSFVRDNYAGGQFLSFNSAILVHYGLFDVPIGRCYEWRLFITKKIKWDRNEQQIQKQKGEKQYLFKWFSSSFLNLSKNNLRELYVASWCTGTYRSVSRS